MKKLLAGVLIGILLAIVVVTVGANTNGAPALTYVYSDSMEPLIQVNDGFLVWPSPHWKVGDIVMYRPVVLKAPYITHRIIGVDGDGYITKGDNAPYSDQSSGEPAVKVDRMVGKVVVFNGKPLIVRGLGTFSSYVQDSLKGYARILSGVLLVLGILSALTVNKDSRRHRKSRRRLRLRDIYHIVGILAIGVIVFSVYMGSRVTQIKYLVSEYPGEMGDQVEINQPDQLTMNVKNNGLVPVWNIAMGIPPLSVQKDPEILWPQSEETVVIGVEPQRKTGVYQGYVRVYNYPVLMPRTWINFLHRISPVAALAGIGAVMGFWFTIFTQILNHIRGLEEWIPLRALADKMAARRMQRLRAKLAGRKRVRSG